MRPDACAHARGCVRAAIRSVAGLVLIGTAGACRQAPTMESAQSFAADSIAIERSVCYGFCPAYRLTIHPSGAVHFVTTARGDTVQRADTIAPREFRWLVSEAHRVGFFTVPTEIVNDTTLCAARATDHPTVTVTIFRGDSTHSVVDYRGCYMNTALRVAPALGPLRGLESAIDSVAGSRRWLDLARPR